MLVSPNVPRPVSPMFPRVAALLLGIAASGLLQFRPAQALPTLEPGWPQTTGYSVSQSAVQAQLDLDPEWEIVISSQDGYCYVYNHDGSLGSGWPRYMGPALWADQWVNQCSSPAVHDLNGDGTPEIIVGNFDAKLYVFEADGTTFPGFPYTAGFMIFSTPAIGDIDGDGAPEIVFGDNDGNINALNHDGSVCAGFPFNTPYVVRSSPALGDLDGDGFDEIVITADNSDYQLYVLDGDGSSLPGFPKVLWQSGANSSPSLGDVDADGDLEIVVGARDGSLHVLNHDGVYLPGWPLDAGYSLESSPTLANLDFDLELEIIVGLNDSKVSIYNVDGSFLPGWPRPTSYTVVSSASVGNLDGDSDLEIVIGENTGLVYGWNVDGTAVPGFPLTDATYTIYSSPLLEDLDLDGSLELLIGCNDTKVYCWDLGAGTSDPDLLPWPRWRHDSRNRANVSTAGAAGVESDGVLPLRLVLEQNRPNPFRGSTVIGFQLSGTSGADLRIYDSAGRMVRRFPFLSPSSPGSSVTWDGRDDLGRALVPGMYVYRLQGSGGEATGRAVLVR